MPAEDLSAETSTAPAAGSTSGGLDAGRAWVEPDAPAQPVRTAQRSLPPPLLRGVERPDAGEQTVGGGVEVRGSPGDLVRECDRIAQQFLKYTATSEIYTLSLHDALP